jgi:hypothetical protein
MNFCGYCVLCWNEKEVLQAQGRVLVLVLLLQVHLLVLPSLPSSSLPFPCQPINNI